MKKIVLQKENGEVREVDYSELFENATCDTHLCWKECVNATPLRCEKIYDEKKQRIDQYDFITDGFQVLVGKKNKIDRFHVSGCNNYEQAEKKEKLPANELKRINNIKRDIAMLYYDAGTIEEADAIQKFQIERGLQRKPKTRKY